MDMKPKENQTKSKFIDPKAIRKEKENSIKSKLKFPNIMKRNWTFYKVIKLKGKKKSSTQRHRKNQFESNKIDGRKKS